MSGSSGKRHMAKIDAMGVAALLGISLAAYLIGVRPVVLDHHARRVLNERLDSEVRTRRELAGRVNRLSDNLTSDRRELNALPVKLQDPGQINHRLAELIQLADDSGLHIASTLPGQVVRTDLYGAVGIRIEGSGPYASCVAFLDRMHDRFADTGVRTIRLAGNSADPYQDPMFKFELVWYVRLDGQPT